MRGKRLIPPLVLIVVWQILCSLGWIPAYKLPSPLQVFTGLKDLIVIGLPPGHRLHMHALYSLQKVFLGYSMAVLIAVPLGIAMGWSKRIRYMVEPLVELFRPIPPLAWIPIAILWFGIGIKSAAFIIFLGAFFPVLLNTASGVLSIDPILIEAALTLDADPKDVIFKVLIPGATPSIITGMRIGLGLGWMTLVAARFSPETGYYSRFRCWIRSTGTSKRDSSSQSWAPADVEKQLCSGSLPGWNLPRKAQFS